MNNDQNHPDYITQLLESKLAARQRTYKHLPGAFSLLSKESQRIISELKKKVNL